MKFGKEELKKGTDREMEHTDSRKEAAKIAKDHLKEKPDYYTELDKCIPESKQEKTHIVIGNRGKGSQTLWPKSEAPELYSQSEAEAIATKMNGKPGIKFGPTIIHWHTKHIDVAHKFVNHGQPAWRGLSKLKDVEGLEEETLDESNKYKEEEINMNKKDVKEGVNGEHGPDEDEDQLDRIERKKMERSKKAAAKVKAIKKAQVSEAMLGGEKYKGKENPNNKKRYGLFDIAKKHNAKESAEIADDKHRELGARQINSKPRSAKGKAKREHLIKRHTQGAIAADKVHPNGTTGFHGNND